jgi:hypothetical protein
MTTDTGMTAVGTIVDTIGAETTGAGITGAESKPAEKLNAVVIGSAIRTAPCGTVTRTATVTIVADAKPMIPRLPRGVSTRASVHPIGAKVVCRA